MGTISMALQPDPSSLDRESALYMAKLAEQAERYDDMVKYMRRIVDLGIPANELSVEERNLLSVGYKNMMSVRRTAWRTVQQYLEKNKEDGNEKNAGYDENYSDYISQEVFKLIDEVRDDIVNVYVDGKNKCSGDDDAEVTEGDAARKSTYTAAAAKAYENAQEVAKNLPSTNPIRLGLALNFSVFHYEICDQKQEASTLAKEAFDTAIDHLDTLGDDEYKDSTLIMQLLKDNLTLWNNDELGGDDGDDIQVEDVQ